MDKFKILEYLQHDINDLKGIITCGKNEIQEKDVIKAQAKALFLLIMIKRITPTFFCIEQYQK